MPRKCQPCGRFASLQYPAQALGFSDCRSTVLGEGGVLAQKWFNKSVFSALCVQSSDAGSCNFETAARRCASRFFFLPTSASFWIRWPLGTEGHQLRGRRSALKLSSLNSNSFLPFHQRDRSQGPDNKSCAFDLDWSEEGPPKGRWQTGASRSTVRSCHEAALRTVTSKMLS